MKNAWEYTLKFFSLLWKIILIVSVLFGLYAAYDQLYRKPSIFSQVIAETNILDIHEPLEDLQILFQGDNIKEKNLNLRVYKVKLINTGGTNITQSDFDLNDNWGIRVDGGKVIEVRLVESNSKYMTQKLSPQIEGDSIIKLNKTIFDKGDYFSVEFLVLHDKSTPPVLYMIGKIAGISASESQISSIDNSEPFRSALFHGSWKIIFARYIIDALVSVFIFICGAVIFTLWDQKRLRNSQNPQLPQQPVQ